MAFLRSILLLSFAAFISSSYGADSKSWFSSGPKLNNIKVTFSLNPMEGYQGMELTRSQAVLQGWKSISGSDCTNGGKYNGFRYIYGDDSSISMLYDVNGNAVGIQMNINKTSVKVPGNNYQFENVAMYNVDVINGLDVYTLTAYFVDPSIICTTGRTDESVKVNGTATNVFLQNGPTPAAVIEIPYQRADAIAAGWTKNNCFVAMGYHNFYQSGNFKDSNCNAFRPAFGLYDTDGSIIGFGLASVGKAYSANKRYENPDAKAIKLIVGSVEDGRLSQCLPDLADSVGLTTMHVYFTNFSRGFTCV